MKTLLFVLSLLFSALLYAQELPPIENFTPVDYGAENQNWAITQSKEKYIYVANNSGLLEFTSAKWKLYPSPNGSALRSVIAVDSLLYTGCYMEFGYWKKNKLGERSYISLLDKLKIPLLEDEEFWNIVAFDQWVLFQSLERIYIFDSKDESIDMIDSKSSKAQMFNFDGGIYFQKISEGIFKIENGQSVLVSDHPIVQDTHVVGIFLVEDKPLILNEKGRFYFLEGTDLIERNIQLYDQFSTTRVYSSLQLDDGSIVLGTISEGMVQLDKSGKLIKRINQGRGLNNNTILNIFEDNERNLWLALDNGISVLNLNSPFKEYIDKNGKLGLVYASLVYKDRHYLGTNQGLFFNRIGVDEEFTLVQNTEGQVWFLKEIDGVLFCGHNNGTYSIKEDKAILIADFPGTWDVKKIPGKKNLLVQGNFNGLSILEKTNDQWKFRNSIEGFDISSRFFEFTGEHQITVNRELKGIYKLDLDTQFKQVLQFKHEASKGAGASLVSYDDEVLYTSSSGIFQYDVNSRKFEIDTPLTSTFYGHNDNPIGIFISDAMAERMWAFTSKNIVYVSPNKFNNSPRLTKIAIPSFLRKNMGVLGFENLTPLEDENYLIGISNGYLTLDLNKLNTKGYEVRINAISNKSNGSEIEKIPFDAINSFEFSANNLYFSYAIAEFDKYTEATYQYQLEGLYDGWSEWNKTPEASFENLPYGDYTFKVRGKTGNSLSTNVASYEFTIGRPWYLSNLAILIYALVIVLLASVVHRLYKVYYKKQQRQLLRENEKKLKRKKLKAQKKIVQIKNEKLREEVDNKNRELAISTMSIIKKNEFLNAIKDQLKDNQDNPQIKAVIKTIDRNIANEDDWKFFEDAFNNADKDFLKKVKGLHPELTANDLRLCAYLRLNLSSKEMAPLLNISVKSVEVKRYRLRKKMNLPHEDGLADYILQV